MSQMQTRRRFLTTLSLAGAAGFVRASPMLAAAGPLETTTVRIAKTLASALPRNTSPRSCCARKVLPMSATWRRPTRRRGSPAARWISG